MRNTCKNAETDPTSAMVLTQIKDGRKLCAKDLILVFEVSRATAYRDIDELVKLSLLCRVGQRKLEYYTAL